MISDSELNIIRGKALVMAATREELFSVFERLDELESWLDEQDDNDTFGTEGWRHAVGLED